MFLYIDETGQTGANFLDPWQPHFICAALVTRADFDHQCSEHWPALLARHGLTELHSHAAGPRTIEALAHELVDLLDGADARFCVARVEKRYALATNVFQVLFDPGENSASDWMFIEHPVLRRRVAVQLGYALTDEVGAAFCDCLFVQRSPAKIIAALVVACDLLLDRLHLIPDELMRLSVGKVTRWARNNPACFMIKHSDKKAGDGRHPNLIGFNNLVHCAQRIHARWAPTTCRIVHDQQGQYQKVIAYWQNLWSRATPGEHVLPSGEKRTYCALPNTEIVFANSALSPGLQAVDACLWIVGRGFQQKRLDKNAVRLLEYVLTHSELSDYSFEGAREIIAA